MMAMPVQKFDGWRGIIGMMLGGIAFEFFRWGWLAGHWFLHDLFPTMPSTSWPKMAMWMFFSFHWVVLLVLLGGVTGGVLIVSLAGIRWDRLWHQPMSWQVIGQLGGLSLGGAWVLGMIGWWSVVSVVTATCGLLQFAPPLFLPIVFPNV